MLAEHAYPCLLHHCLANITTPHDTAVIKVALHCEAAQGDYQEGYDVLDSSCEKSTQHFQRAAVCGFLRHAQVCEVCAFSSQLTQTCSCAQGASFC